MAIRGLRKIEADVIRHKAYAAMTEGSVVGFMVGVAADTSSLLRSAYYATSGNATVLGILLDKVVARPAEAEDSSDATLAGIKSDWIFTAATPLFQEAGDRFVGEEVGIMRKGLITVNTIARGATPSGGLYAWAAEGGTISAGATGSGTPIGVWQTAADSDSYAQLYLDVGMAPSVLPTV